MPLSLDKNEWKFEQRDQHCVEAYLSGSKKARENREPKYMKGRSRYGNMFPQVCVP